jgi:hypothetical protein
MLELWSVLEYRKDRLINWAAARVLMFDTLDKKMAEVHGNRTHPGRY